MLDRPTLVLEFTHELARVDAEEPFHLRLCRAYTRFARADGGAISLGYTGAERKLLCSTDDDVSLVEDVQDTLREGPTLDAFRTKEPVLYPPGEEQARQWPVLIRSMPTSIANRDLYAFPMQPDDTLVGVVTLHLQPERGLGRQPAELNFLADVLGAAIVGGVPADHGRHVLWSERDRISQATGMVVAQLGISPADALAVLRAHAFAHETPVSEISHAVLARELMFTDTDGQDS